MNPWAIGVEAASIANGIAGEVLLLGDKIDDIEAQAINAAIGPELADFFQLGAYRRVFPVEIRLLGGEKMQIILFAFRMPLPGVTAEFRTPVIRQCSRLAVAPDIELAVRARLI